MSDGNRTGPAIGTRVQLKLRQRPGALGPTVEVVDGKTVAVPSFSCELLLDGKPLWLVQSLKLEVDAQSQVPMLTIKIIPTDIEIDFDAQAVLRLDLLPGLGLTRPQGPIPVAMAKMPDADTAALLAAYRAMFPEADVVAVETK